MLRILYIGTVWAERHASAAGVRAWQLLQALQAQGADCVFASTAADHPGREELETAGIPTRSIALNDPSFDAWIAELQPQVVIFDRFMTEEQFSWRVREQAPGALRILDTVDLHSLREARQLAYQSKAEPAAVLTTRPSAEQETLQRELAAIWRSDLSWVVSDIEEQFLRNACGIPEHKVDYLPLVGRVPEQVPGCFDAREHFVFVGNFRHPPNADAVRYLHETLWPMISPCLNGVELHIYGAYPPKAMMDLDDPATGFRVQGPARDLHATLARYRVMLAPLRFGAGLKGKVLDAWQAGTPVIGSAIAAEGLYEDGLEQGDEPFAAGALACYSDAAEWARRQAFGSERLRSRFGPEHLDGLAEKLQARLRALPTERASDFTGQSFWQQGLRSTEYFSRWIEAKNSR